MAAESADGGGAAPPQGSVEVVDAEVGPRPPPATAILTGYLLSEDNTPLTQSGTNLVATGESGEQTSAVLLTADGRYRISPLSPGRWWVSARAAGHHPLVEEVVIPPGVGEVERNLVLRRATVLEVYLLTPDGRQTDVVAQERGLNDAYGRFVAVATLTRPGRFWSGEPHEVGRVRDAGLRKDAQGIGPWGTMTLSVDPPVFVSLVMHQYVIATELVAAGETHVEFVLTPEDVRATAATLHLRLLDAETREPVTSGVVALTAGHELLRPKFDEAGVAVFEGCPPGHGRLTCFFSRYETLEHDLLLEPGVVTELEFELKRPTCFVEGRVVTSNGPAARFAKLRWAKIGEEGAAPQSLVSYGTSEDGSFHLNLPAGEHVLRARSANSSAVSRNVVVDTRGGSVDGVELVIVDPTTVVLAPTARWDGRDYRIVDEEGNRLAGGRFDGMLPQREQVAPGPCLLRVTGGDGELLLELPFRAEGREVRIPLD